MPIEEAPRQKFYKALTLENKSFYDGITQWHLGVPMPEIYDINRGPCGQGYHLGKSVKDTISYAKFPMLLYEAEPCGELLGSDSTKARFASAKIVREIKKPSWVIRTEKFIASIPSLPWLKATEKARRAWKMFDTRNAARAAAWAAAGDAAWDAAWAAARDAAWDAARAAARAAAGDAARDAAWDAAGDAARDASLMTYMEIISDLKLDKKHRNHARDRWAVWQAGYGLLCDVNGELYCYRKVV